MMACNRNMGMNPGMDPGMDRRMAAPQEQFSAGPQPMAQQQFMAERQAFAGGQQVMDQQPMPPMMQFSAGQQPMAQPSMSSQPQFSSGQQPMSQPQFSSGQPSTRQLNEASFAMDDVLLFLDTHPDCAEAMQYYRNATSMRRSAIAAWQRQNGPLFVDEVTGPTWDWVTEKWPWEGGY